MRTRMSIGKVADPRRSPDRALIRVSILKQLQTVLNVLRAIAVVAMSAGWQYSTLGGGCRLGVAKKISPASAAIQSPLMSAATGCVASTAAKAARKHVAMGIASTRPISPHAHPQ